MKGLLSTGLPRLVYNKDAFSVGLQVPQEDDDIIHYLYLTNVRRTNILNLHISCSLEAKNVVQICPNKIYI